MAAAPSLIVPSSASRPGVGAAPTPLPRSARPPARHQRQQRRLLRVGLVRAQDGKKWGLCKDCKWWKIEPDDSVANKTTGLY
jgi:hypothetical protein